MITLIKDDCLEKYKEIKPGSVDLILTDLPYGMITERHDWDIKIDLKAVLHFKIAEKRIRENFFMDNGGDNVVIK
jgi:DNA modification methylase